MKFAAAVIFAGVAAAGIIQVPKNGTHSEVYTTEVVTAFTTYCPEATTFSHGGVTYTVTEVRSVVTTVYPQQLLTENQATTLTITNCPCTITKPVT